MPREFHRSRRVAESIHRTLCELLRDEVHDTRLADATLTHVDVSRDLAVAKVYYTVRRDSEHDVAAAFTSASGFLRRKLAHVMTLRSVPQLRFLRDESIERGESLSALIVEARASDEAKARESGDDPEPEKS